MKKLFFTIFALTFLVSFQSDETNPVTDFLGVGKTIVFNDLNFNLAWSSNSEPDYYKQEYLLDSTSLENYNEMFLIEAIKGQISPELAIETKIAELTQLKKDNPVINWSVYKNKDELILDYVISDNATVFEWNLYRYSTLKDKKKQKYLVLCAYSFKDELYSNTDLKPFFNRILDNRDDYISRLGKLSLPTLNFQTK